MRRWAFALLVAGQLLAGVVIFLSGAFYAETNRYDDCRLVVIGRDGFWMCPAQVLYREREVDADDQL